MTRRRPWVVAVLSAVVVTAGTAVAQPRAAGDASVSVSSSDRDALAVTIYNNGLGLVRERRKVRFPRRGRVVVSFTDVAPTIIAPSVSLVAAPRPTSFRVVEQLYRYDVLSPSTLLERAAGTTLTLQRTNLGNGGVDRVSGTAMADVSQHGIPVLQTSEGITYYERYSAIGFSELPARWSSRPSLSWLLDVREPGETGLAVSYLSRGMQWSADYVFVLGTTPRDASELVGWITLVNRSGAGFEGAHLAVVAGKVNVVDRWGPASGEEYSRRDRVLKSAPAAPRATRSALAEYHLYDIPSTTDLPDQSSKQVTFLASERVRPTTRYIIDDPPIWRPDRTRRGATSVETAQTELRFDIKEDQGLGVPMPAGTIRVFARDRQGVPQFVGQSSIGHTPRDETIKIRLGPASDIRLVRKLMDRSSLGRLRKDTVSYQVRNAKPYPVQVDVTERSAKLDHATLPATHPDARTTVFTVSVPAGGETTWRAEYTEGWR